MKQLLSILFLAVATLVVSQTAHSAIDLSGKVTQFGSPIRFQKIYFKGSGIDTNAVTDSRGNYTIKLFPSNIDGIFVGYTKNCLEDTLSLLKEYGPITTSVILNFKLCEFIQTTTIKGGVFYQGKPLPNAIVRFSFNSSNNIIDSTVADSVGRYVRTLTVASQSSGLLYASIKNCDGQNIEKSTFYSVNDTCNLNFQYCIGGNFKILTGRVINENTLFKKNDVSLYLFEYDIRSKQLHLLEKQTTDIEGVFQFMLSRGNQYILKAVPKNSLPIIPNYYGNSFYWNSAEVISFMGDSIRYIDIPVESLLISTGNSDITGEVKDQRINRYKPHTIYLLNEALELVDYTSCNESGRFQFSNLPAGSYTMHTDVVGLPTNAPSFTLNPNSVLSEYTIIISKQQVSYEVQSLGTTENELLEGLSVFPTPFESKLQIRSNFDYDNSLIIKDITGKIIHEATLSPFSTSTINTALWERGVYVIYRFDEDQVRKVTKTIKR